MTEASFPIVGKDYTNSQFSAVGSAVASGILDQGGNPYALTVSDTDNTLTLGVSSIDSRARAVVAGFGHLLDAPVTLSVPAVTSSTVYHVGLRYDPTRASNAAGPVFATVISGTVQMPNDGSVFVEFYRITRAPSTVLSASSFLTVRPSVAPAMTVDTKAALLAMDRTKILLNTTVYVRDIAATATLQTGGWLLLGGSARVLFLQAPLGASGLPNDGLDHGFHSSDPFTVDTAEQADVSFECIAGGTGNWLTTFIMILNGVEIARRSFRNNGGGNGYLPIILRTKATLRSGSNLLTITGHNNSSSSGPVLTQDPQFRVFSA